MRHISNKKRQGFTLLEIIIAIFIITIGMVGAMNLINYNISVIAITKSQIIAASLAQEGLEIVRNIRDNNWIEQRIVQDLTWNDGLAQGDYQADYTMDYLDIYNPNNYLQIDSNGFYQYGTGSPTLFKRKITITNISADEIRVISEVSWNERGRSHVINAQDGLYDWK